MTPEAQRRRNARMIQEGRCVQCSEKHDRGTWRCARCVVANRSAAMRSYHKAIRRGRCGACRKPWNSDGHATCGACREAAKTRFRKEYKKPVGLLAPRRGRTSGKMAALDEATPCGRCSLRGPHECLRGDATARRAA